MLMTDLDVARRIRLPDLVANITMTIQRKRSRGAEEMKMIEVTNQMGRAASAMTIMMILLHAGPIVNATQIAVVVTLSMMTVAVTKTEIATAIVKGYLAPRHTLTAIETEIGTETGVINHTMIVHLEETSTTSTTTATGAEEAAQTETEIGTETTATETAQKRRTVAYSIQRT